MSATTRNPKHEHINRYEVLNIINDAINNNPLSYKGFVNEIMERVKTASADVVERKRGKWKTAYLDHEAFGVRPHTFYCSECHQMTSFRTFFCPNCGADMREEPADV